MKCLLQRVRYARVEVDNNIVAEIGTGMLVLVGFEASDESATLSQALKKLTAFRIFDDANGKMNLSVMQAAGEILFVPQFTLVADTSRGNRPSFTKGATPARGAQLFDEFKQLAQTVDEVRCDFGVFGANMQVSLCNDGPVTFSLDF